MTKIKSVFIVVVIGSFFFIQLKPAVADSYQEVIYSQGDYTLKGYLCKPEGNGPFPAVVYNHGGKGNKIGGMVIMNESIINSLSPE